MSNPPNILEQYSTYSYHHILIACDTTEVAEAIAQSPKFFELLDDVEPNTPDDPFAQYSARPFQGPIQEKEKRRTVKGNYVVVINGMTDSEFVIQQANWYQTVAANSSISPNMPVGYQVLGTDGKMVVQEPRGVRFMNVMSEISDRLQTAPNGMCFLLKTVFIGHQASEFGNTPVYEDFDRKYFTDPILNVKPLLMYIYDITGSFTISGGVYTLNFCAINNGASKVLQIMKANDRISINISEPRDECESNTLYGALCRLQNRIQNLYNTHYEETIKTIKEGGVNFDGRYVRYTIDLEEPYVIKDRQTGETLEGNPDYIVDDFKTQVTEKGEKNEGGVIHLGKETSVEGAILAIVNRCSKVQEELAKKKSGTQDSSKKIRYLPKVESTIRSTQTEYEVIYKVKRVMEARNATIERLAKRTSDNIDDLALDLQANLLELDYIYTGKNVDVLDFDINMNMGTAFLQTISTANSIPTNIKINQGGDPTQGDTSNGATQVDPQDPGNTEEGETLKKQVAEKARITPIFFSTLITKDMIKNATDTKRSGEFSQLLARHAAFENIDVTVKITGNPALLNSLAQYPTEIIKRIDQSDTVNTKQNQDNTVPFPDVFPNWSSIPALVKVNIKMPATDQDAEAFTTDFWYNGFYYCFAIDNTFDAGLFTQTLHMVSVPQESESEENQKEGTDKKQSDETKTASGSQSTAATPEQIEQALAENPDEITVEQYLQAQFRTDAGC